MGNQESKESVHHKYLLDPNTNQDEVREALYVGCASGDAKLVDLILKNRIVDLNIQVGINEEGTSKQHPMISACKNGHHEVVQLLIANGVSVDLQDEDGISALICASYFGHYEVVKFLITNGAEVNLKGKNKGSALMFASYNGHCEVAKILLENGASVDLQKEDGWSALMSASSNGHSEVAKILLENGASVDLQNEDGWSALMSASSNGHSEVTKILLENGASVDLQKEDGWSALMSASSNGHSEVAKILLENGAHEDRQDEDGFPALMYASQEGHSEVAKILLENGASVDLQSEDGRFALMSASYKGHSEVAKILLENGASVDLQNEDGWSALMLASQEGHSEVTKILLENGASVDLQIEDGKFALMSASFEGHSEVAKILLENGASVDLQNEDGWSALMLASQEGHSEIAKILLDNGASVDLQNEVVGSALMSASFEGHSEVAKILLDNGASVDLQNEDGWSALMSASFEGHSEVAKILLDNGASVDLQNEVGGSALMSASFEGHSEVAKILLENGASVDLQKEDGWSALMLASQEGHSEVANILLENGANVDLQMEDGGSALVSASHGGHSEVAKILLENGASVDMRKKTLFSNLIISGDDRYEEIIEILKEIGWADITIEYNFSPTCYGSHENHNLMISLNKNVHLKSLSSCTPVDLINNHIGHDESIQTLLESGAKVKSEKCSDIHSKNHGAVGEYEEDPIVLEIKDNDMTHEVVLKSGGSWRLHENCRYSALILACTHGHSKTVELLLENGASVNEHMDNGMSALMFASQNGHAGVVKMLLKHGAEVNLTNSHNQTALMLATEARDKHVIGFVGEHTIENNPQPEINQTVDSPTVPRPLNIQESILQPIPRVKVLHTIPETARTICCSKFASILENVIKSNFISSWNNLFHFATNYLKAPLQVNQNKPLASIVQNQLQHESPGISSASVYHVTRKKTSVLASKVSNKLRDGDVRGAVQLASSSDVPAEFSDKTYRALKYQFPSSPHNAIISPIPTIQVEKDFNGLTTSTILRAVRSLPSGSAGGPGLLRPRHLKDMLNSCRGDSDAPLLNALVKLCKLVLCGNIPESVRSQFFGAHLVALETKSGEVRPILVGCTLRRLVAKVASYLVQDEMTRLLLPRQLGYGVRGGSEAAIHAARHYLANMSNDEAVVKICFNNAFNSLKRDRMLEAVHDLCPVLYPYVYSAYSAPSDLHWGNKTLQSAEGLQQGDPLAPLLFCLTLHRHYQQLKSEFCLQHVDHVILGGNLESLLHDIRVMEETKLLGLHLRAEVMCRNCSIRGKLCHSFSSLQPVSLLDATFLGTPLGDHTNISKRLLQKVDELKSLGECIKHIETKDALVLLRSFFAFSKLHSLLRTFPCFRSYALNRYNIGLRKIFSAVTDIPLKPNSAAWSQATLPIRLGGLGVQSAVRTAASAFLASSHASSDLVNAVLPSNHRSSSSLLDEATASWSQSHAIPPPEGTRACRQKYWNVPRDIASAEVLVKGNEESSVKLLALSTRKSRAWLHKPPASTTFLRLDDTVVKNLVKLRLGTHGADACDVCEYCGAFVDTLGHHFTDCPYLKKYSLTYHDL